MADTILHAPATKDAQPGGDSGGKKSGSEIDDATFATWREAWDAACCGARLDAMVAEVNAADRANLERGR